MVDFTDVFNALSNEDFEEVPVMIEEFVTSPEYLGLETPLSEYQYQMVRAGSQIYTYDTLVNLYGQDIGSKRYDQTCSECIYALGKGSGKDFVSTIVCAYVVYLLLCLKNPQKYYGKPAENAIDILNVATNSDQAKNVFFKNLRTIIKNCPWFNDKYDSFTQNSVSFDKSITLYSGHSERESFEGLNLFLAVLDEISAFAHTENESPKQTYETYRDSVDSRFPGGVGKVLLLSFPRKKEGDFIMDKYNEVVVEKEVILRHKTLKLDQSLPDGINGNEFEVEWEEDHILQYKYEKIFALKRPSWEVNPTRNIEMYTRNFHTNMPNALAKFACMPTDGGDDALFKNPDILESIFTRDNLVDSNGEFLTASLNPRDKRHFIHVDLSKVHDRCAVAVAHVESWLEIQVSPTLTEQHPVVVVDMLRWWEPSHEEPMDYQQVTDFILAVRRNGFNIKGCTLDRWQSHDTINFLNSVGIPTTMFSVKDEHFDTLLTLSYDQRISGPKVPELITELKQLSHVKGKVDHPRNGYKDLSDAVTGAVNNAIINTPRPRNEEVEVISYADMVKRNRAAQLEAAKEAALMAGTSGVISAPKREIPQDLKDYMQAMRLL